MNVQWITLGRWKLVTGQSDEGEDNDASAAEDGACAAAGADTVAVGAAVQPKALKGK
eukprot:CAMPEP_0174386372 /NCGR_PEP_ID=MMETSP0811_2-20130205/127229_1 /TAXON_ID=73025 ORGANISM="Eutreptiella gymnastica-like, Strain CCMP1594" /NCGR_SAMPLE_ID=MMETSP0811_2 /ASSEMBLY_ACC=CAM_ASM_000667 /LENGTH=56 /DNA_ID=CAMNT_0015541013 /DNA_START=1098 /DNA_END=1268 /DNA_ORIENTATION=+